jgi:hypothetical protein
MGIEIAMTINQSETGNGWDEVGVEGEFMRGIL